MRTMPSRRVVGNTRWLLAGGFSRESLYDEKDSHLEVPIAIQNTTAECVVSGNIYSSTEEESLCPTQFQEAA